jgi:hypothetical protein
MPPASSTARGSPGTRRIPNNSTAGTAARSGAVTIGPSGAQQNALQSHVQAIGGRFDDRAPPSARSSVRPLSVITLQQHFAGATGVQAQALDVTGESLVAMRQWTFLLGPGVMAGVNDLLLGYILYRSGLVGRVIPIIGLVGGPLILLSDLATILGAWGQVSTAGFLFALPVAVFEFSVGVYLTVKGFRSAALAALDAPSGPTPEAVAGA